ncbi:MAG: ADP-ribosylglycohydrolase family protein [Desulfovibrio sp.]|nr:ADP-ribosylglycohydrolase family protein [Desulfovibrio sp.]
MLGAIVGDIVGSPYEFHNIKTTDFPLFCQKSRFTDDTVMTIAVALGLCQGANDPDATREAIIDAMHELGMRHFFVGYGQKFAQWLLRNSREPYGSYGNGSAMRVSSVGWMFSTLDDVERYAEISATVTHNHPAGIKGAKSVAAAIFMAHTGSSKDDIRSYITSQYGYDLSRTLDEIRPTYRHIESCQGSVPEAIIAFLESNDFEDAIRKAISLGGDSDTIGAITGSIAEAFYGAIPEWIQLEAMTRLDDNLRTLVVDCTNAFHAKG